MDPRATQLIKQLGLKSHPEGGYYKETYKSSEQIAAAALPEQFRSPRHFSTCIYFLMTSKSFSAFHRIQQDEIWHFYDGSPISLHILSPDGHYANHRIGRDIPAGELPQVVVSAGHWFAAEVIEENSFSLVGCTVAPGFSFEDFELGTRTDLTRRFPDFAELIGRLTRQ